MGKRSWAGQWALVTGASSGLGREIALQLAEQHGVRPLLVARRSDRLEALQHELKTRFDVPSRVIVADLSRPDDVDELYRQATAENPVSHLVLNAGITYFGAHEQLEFAQLQQLMATNVQSILRLVHLFLPHLRQLPHPAHILLVSSLAGLLPVPYQAAYSGTKGFLCNFGIALHHELRRTNVVVTVFAPGGIETELLDKSGLSRKFNKKSPFIQSAESCAKSAVWAMRRGRMLHVPGVFNNLSLFAARLLPRAWMAHLVGSIYEDALRVAREPVLKQAHEKVHVVR